MTLPTPTNTSQSKSQKGMYGLPQAGILAQELLGKCLNKHGHCQSPITPGLWRHDFCPISFTLCVDDFGIKYVNREHVDHLFGILKEHYKCSQDWSGTCYLGIISTRTTSTKMSMSPCLIMYLRLSSNSNICHQQSPNINRILTSNPRRVQPNNMRRP
jgi:hypothetical protein